MMKNQLAGLMKQAQAMQDNMKKAQEAHVRAWSAQAGTPLLIPRIEIRRRDPLWRFLRKVWFGGR